MAALMLEKRRRRARAAGSRGLDLLTWTLANRRNLGPNKPFELVNHPFLVDVYQERAREAVFCKAGQVGLSEYAISYALHACDQRRATCLYVFPTDKHVSDFSAARIGPAMEASEYLDSIVIEGGAAGGKRGADRVLLKRVRDNFVYFRGAKVDAEGNAPQLKSVDGDCLILDEVDEMDPRAPEIAKKRLGHSEIAEERWISTPTYNGVGIHAKYQASDQREWHVQCGGCGEWQPMTISQVVGEWDDLGRPVAWNGQAEGRAFVACRKCGREIDRLGPGRWVALYPDRDLVGYHVTKMFSQQINLLAVVRTLQKTDETARKECFNQDLGEPYTPKGGQLINDDLDACRREYGHAPVKIEHGETVMGVDVGKLLHVVVRGPADPETGERAQRWAGDISGFDDLTPLMRRYGVRTVVIDALPETRKAREFQSAHPPKTVWLAYYVTQRIGTKRAEPVQWDIGEGIVNLDRTRTLDETLAGFYSQTSTLPLNARDITDYYTHLTALVRVLEDAPNGQRVARYVNNGPDHLAHAENYCRVAFGAPFARREARSYRGY